jgi:hypothetical protein
MSPIKPFENEEESLSIGDLTVENRTDRVELYGRIHLTRDRKGLEMARQMKALIDSVLGALEKAKDLPDEVVLTNKPRPAKNPFG